MEILIITLAVAVIALFVWLVIQNGKKKPDAKPVSQPVAPGTPTVDEVPSNNEPEKPAEESVKEEEQEQAPEATEPEKPAEPEPVVIQEPEPEPEVKPEVEVKEEQPEPESEPEKPVLSEVKQEPDRGMSYDECLDKFRKYVDIKKDTTAYRYFYELYREAQSQFRKDTCHGIPAMIRRENFPTLYDFGEKGDPDKAFNTLVGWLFALQMSELKPRYRSYIGKIGYELGGYDRYENVYGWKFELDPSVMRRSAAAIYVAMKGYCKPDIDAMRTDVGGAKYNSTLQQLYDGNSRDNVSKDGFFIDFRMYLPTAPGPYAPGYTTRPDRTFPDEQRDEYDNLKMDRNIHEMIVEMYNLDVPEHFQEVVQAIADKESEKGHLFGRNVTTKHYKFHPVFGGDTIGLELSPTSFMASFAHLLLRIGSSSRGIMQSATVEPKQYGRLRPGCSWKQEGKKNSSSDNRRNVLTDFEIEDGDGSPTGYYDKNGNWVYKNGIHNPDEFEEWQRNSLYANSYPSGHSSGIFCSAMLLMELFPNLADKILRAANQYALNRTIARYHWTSDTIYGMILGSAMNAVCHASSDFYDMLAKSRI